MDNNIYIIALVSLLFLFILYTWYKSNNKYVTRYVTYSPSTPTTETVDPVDTESTLALASITDVTNETTLRDYLIGGNVKDKSYQYDANDMDEKAVDNHLAWAKELKQFSQTPTNLDNLKETLENSTSWMGLRRPGSRGSPEQRQNMPSVTETDHTSFKRRDSVLGI